MDTLRLFIAIDLPTVLKVRLDAIIKSLEIGSREVKWVRPENIHITMKFLGDTPKTALTKIEEALGASVVGMAPINIKIEGIGAFPSLKSPKVLWAGLKTDDGLKRLYENIEMHLSEAGFERDSRAFNPHVTLCRIRSAKEGLELGRRVRSMNIIIDESFIADSITLFSSTMTRDGSIYRAIKRVELT